MESARSIPISDDVSDEHLLALLAAGRQDVLAPLYGRYARLIFDIAARSLDRTAAEEIVQDVFLSVWRRAGTFDAEQGSFRPWVLQLAHWRILNELRRRSRRPHLEPDDEGQLLAALPDAGPDPGDEAWQAERRAVIRDALNSLPPAQRQALGMAFFDDLTHQQVAARLNLPLGTAKTRIRTGLHAMRGHLAPLAAAISVLVLLSAGVARELQTQADLAREQRALALVVTSDLAPIRMTAAPGIPDATHGTYRGRAGATVAVLTVSSFSPAPAGHAYQAWAGYQGRWVALGTVHPDASGADRVIAESPELASLPDSVIVTLEDAQSGGTPSGPTIVAWSAGA